jgi:hypothetical protein
MHTLTVRKGSSLVGAALFIALGSMPSRAQVNMTTWHNDNWRTGQNT